MKGEGTRPSNRERLERINDRWGNYDLHSTKGMTEFCLDIEWLLERVEELEAENESLRERLSMGRKTEST